MSLAEISPVVDERNARARETALQAIAQVAVEPTSVVGYRSQGRLLIIGEAERALAVAARVDHSNIQCHVLAWGDAVSQARSDLPLLLMGRAQRVQVSGHLGEFTVTLTDAEHGEVNVGQLLNEGFEHFDLILDLDTPAHVPWEILPLGYYAPHADETALQEIIAELPDRVGEFEKATFFQYNPDICAHGSRGLKGCTRCLDACPTGAIRSLGEKIEVDPYYCQGGGSCATACPSGAIIYSYPKPADTLKRLRLLLQAYREAGGQQPMVLFHDAAAGRDRLAQVPEPLPGHVIAVELEEIGSVGMDIWLTVLAHGASRLWLLTTAVVPPSIENELKQQLRFAHALLAGMGYPTNAIGLLDGKIDDASLMSALQVEPAMPALKPAGFTGGNAKRDTLFYAIDFLAAQAPAPPDVLPLPEQAPFGEIQVNREACTLCMACVSVCPTSALFDGIDTPKLEFLEANCVQCGLCETACPENAIARQTRFLFDQQQRRRRRMLHEEAAFHCVQCGKPFASVSMIERMSVKLEGHWMFEGEAARRRLHMCGDCRVRDMFNEELG